MKTRKTSIIALAALLVVALIGGTIAYWNQTSTIDNPFSTGSKYGSTIVEKFTPQDGEDWEPGVTVEKGVTVTNDGDTDILVRAKLTETWTRKGDTTPYITQENGNVYDVHQGNKTDGLTTGDKSVVDKNFAAGDKWTAPDANGWCYLKTNLTKGTTAAEWLQSVTLNKDIDMGKQVSTFYVATDATGTDWYKLAGDQNKAPKYVTISGDTATAAEAGDTGAQPVTYGKHVTSIAADAQGYSNSDYVLTVTVQTVQATQDAVNEVFGGGTTFATPAGCTWTLG